MQEPWLVRIVDDAYVNVKSLPFLLNSINSLYDPYKDFVILGNCIQCNSDFSFLQGGSGFLYSHKASYIFFKTSYEWYRTINYYEDYHLNDYLLRMKFSFYEASSPYIIGHSINVQILFKKGGGALTACKDLSIEPMKKCGSFFIPLKYVVFFHDMDHKTSLLNLSKIFDNTSGIVVYQDNFYSYYCYSNNITDIVLFHKK